MRKGAKKEVSMYSYSFRRKMKCCIGSRDTILEIERMSCVQLVRGLVRRVNAAALWRNRTREDLNGVHAAMV